MGFVHSEALALNHEDQSLVLVSISSIQKCLTSTNPTLKLSGLLILGQLVKLSPVSLEYKRAFLQQLLSTAKDAEFDEDFKIQAVRIMAMIAERSPSEAGLFTPKDLCCLFSISRIAKVLGQASKVHDLSLLLSNIVQSVLAIDESSEFSSLFSQLGKVFGQKGVLSVRSRYFLVRNLLVSFFSSNPEAAAKCISKRPSVASTFSQISVFIKTEKSEAKKRVLILIL